LSIKAITPHNVNASWKNKTWLTNLQAIQKNTHNPLPQVQNAGQKKTINNKKNKEIEQNMEKMGKK